MGKKREKAAPDWILSLRRETRPKIVGLVEAVTPGAADPLSFKVSKVAYSRQIGPAIAFSLLGPKNLGYGLVTRLKDTMSPQSEEVRFWASQLAEIIDVRFEGQIHYVTHPPSSGKREFHLATHLARHVAEQLEMPYASLFSNPNERGHRASLHEKLREAGEAVYEYGRKPDRSHILVIDDVIYTRGTANRCIKAARGDRLSFVVLYM